MALSLPLHGGDLAAAEVRWGRPAAGWLDLSTGINPWPYPLPALPDHAWTRLPGAPEDGALRVAAAHRYGVDPEQVLAAPGTSALIQALPRYRPPGRVAIVGPTYGEHARAWAAAGHEVVEVAALEETACPVVVVVNPNNPDGRALPPETLLDRARLCAGQGGLLVVDEAFGDECPALSVAPHLMAGLVVLRSFGKFYGLAGLRLGFALGMPGIIASLAGQLGPWPVSGPALAIGVAALKDDVWARQTADRLAAWAAEVDGVLAAGGLSVVGGTTLFRLVSHPRAMAVHDRLGAAGILVRAFVGRPHLLRIGLPATQGDLKRLAEALMS